MRISDWSSDVCSSDLRVDAEFARLPRQIERIDRNAVAADARTRIISGEAERLRLRRIDDLEDVEPHPLRDDLHLVDQPNIDGAVDVFEQLDHFRCARRTDRDDMVDETAI